MLAGTINDVGGHLMLTRPHKGNLCSVNALPPVTALYTHESQVFSMHMHLQAWLCSLSSSQVFVFVIAPSLKAFRKFNVCMRECTGPY